MRLKNWTSFCLKNLLPPFFLFSCQKTACFNTAGLWACTRKATEGAGSILDERLWLIIRIELPTALQMDSNQHWSSENSDCSVQISIHKSVYLTKTCPNLFGLEIRLEMLYDQPFLWVFQSSFPFASKEVSWEQLLRVWCVCRLLLLAEKNPPSLFWTCAGNGFGAKSIPNNYIGERNHILLSSEICVVLIPLQDFKATSFLLVALNPIVWSENWTWTEIEFTCKWTSD